MSSCGHTCFSRISFAGSPTIEKSLLSNFASSEKEYWSTHFLFRVYFETIQNIICYYEQMSTENGTNITSHQWLTPDTKRMYLLFSVIIRVVIPFILLLTANIVLFLSLRQTNDLSLKSNRGLLVRHGQHRQVTPMIFFSSCILLLTISPR